MSRKGIKFGSLILSLEVVFIVLIAVFAKYPDKATPKGDQYYPNFQDVNCMIFVGLGFLLTFLKNYGYSAVSFNLVIGGFCVQWGLIVRGFIHADVLSGDKFSLGVLEMTTAVFASATVLISYCVILGKVSATQLVVMAMLELPLAQINEYIGFELLHTSDIGESMYLHMFAAYFGVAVSRVLHDPDVEDNDKEGAVYHSDLFAMLGSVFLWIYWPSFNGGFTPFSERATLNTFMSLCACTVVTFAVSGLTDKRGRFDMVHIQNATLAGGVVVGATADMPMKPVGALVFGCVGGLVCTLGYKYVQPVLASKLKIHDTCGVHNLHGMPAIVAGIGSAVLAAMSSDWDLEDRLEIFSKTVDIVNATGGVVTAASRTPLEQGAFQMAAVFMTIAFAVIGGVITGFIMKLPFFDQPQGGQLFSDEDNFELPDEGFPGTQRMLNGVGNHDMAEPARETANTKI